MPERCMVWRTEAASKARLGAMKGRFEQVLPGWLEHDCQGMEWTVRVHGASWLAQGSVQRAFKLALVADSGTSLQVHVRQNPRRTIRRCVHTRAHTYWGM